MSLFQFFSEHLCLFLIAFFADVNHNNFAVFINHLVKGIKKGLIHIWCRHKNLTVYHTKDIIFMNLKAINSCVTYCQSHATTCYIWKTSCHSFNISFNTLARIESKQACKTLRYRTCFNNRSIDIYYFSSWLCCHKDVFIIWQDDNILSINLLNSLNNIFCWWVHCLTTWNHIVNTLWFEDICKSISGNNCNKSKIFRSRRRSLNGFFFLNLCIVLVAHVVNLNFDKSTIFKTFLHDKTWILCMDVNFYNFIIVNNKERIPKVT